MSKTPLGQPPCNGCTECCKNTTVRLHPEDGDLIENYETTEIKDELGHPAYQLRQKPNGDCVYLGKTGCTIHGRAPAACRSFDCRHAYWYTMIRNKGNNRHTRRKMLAEAKRLGGGKSMVQGKRLFPTLEATLAQLVTADVYYGQHELLTPAELAKRYEQGPLTQKKG